MNALRPFDAPVPAHQVTGHSIPENTWISNEKLVSVKYLNLSFEVVKDLI